MKMDIKTITQNWLNGKGYTLPEGYRIVENRELPLSSWESVGRLTLRDDATEITYLVTYEALTSLHGSGSDDICTVTHVSVAFPTT